MWPWNKQGIASPNLNVTPNQQQYLSGTDWRSKMQPMSAQWGNTNQAPWEGYEDLIQNPEHMPNRLQNLERFQDNRFEGGDELVPGMNKKAIDFIDAPVDFMMRANHPTRFDPLVNAKNFAQDLPSNIKQGIGAIKKGGMKFMTPLMMMASARNPLNPDSQNFNPMLEGQLKNYTDQGWRVDESGKAIDGPLARKNLVSGFGTNDVTAMLRKRLQKIRMRKMAQTDSSMNKQEQILNAIKAQTVAENAGYQGTPGGNVGSGAFAKFDQSGKTYGPYSGGNTPVASSAKGTMPTGTAGRNPWGKADGGRIGYENGELVEQETDFLQEPGENLMASGTMMGSPEELYLKAIQDGFEGTFDEFLEELERQRNKFMATGGRAGYENGELVEQETDFIQGPHGGEEFQETVVEGQEQPSREQLEALAMEIFQLPLEQLDEQQLLVVYQEAMQGRPMEEAVQEEDVQFAAQGGLAGLL